MTRFINIHKDSDCDSDSGDDDDGGDDDDDDDDRQTSESYKSQ